MYLNVKRSIKTKDVGKLKPLMSMLNQLIGLHTLAPNQSQMARALVRSAIKFIFFFCGSILLKYKFVYSHYCIVLL